MVILRTQDDTQLPNVAINFLIQGHLPTYDVYYS